MRSINKVILIGNITRDPELKQTGGGQSIVTFGIATNREWVTGGGEKHSLAEYHNLVAWGKLAEICQQYLKKGKLIYVEGYLKTRSWDSPEGVKIFKTEVVLYDMIMLEKRPSDADVDYSPPEEAVEAPLEDVSAKEPEAEEAPAEEEPKKAEKAPKSTQSTDPLDDITAELETSEKEEK
jgi:single-strand DNA-binding protein